MKYNIGSRCNLRKRYNGRLIDIQSNEKTHYVDNTWSNLHFRGQLHVDIYVYVLKLFFLYIAQQPHFDEEISSVCSEEFNNGWYYSTEESTCTQEPAALICTTSGI